MDSLQETSSASTNYVFTTSKIWNYYHLPVTPDISAIKPSSTFSSSSDLSALMIQSFKHAAIGTLNLEGLIHFKIQLLICQTDIGPSSSSKELVWLSHWLQLTCTSVTRIHWVHTKKENSRGLLVVEVCDSNLQNWTSPQLSLQFWDVCQWHSTLTNPNQRSQGGDWLLQDLAVHDLTKSKKAWEE